MERLGVPTRMNDLVRQTRSGEIAILEIDNPPVNALSQALRQALLDAFIRVDADAAIKGIVLAAAGRTFIAGGDISEFGAPPREPQLPDLVNRIEAARKPVVVAWHGTALGGGCEIGLAAHRRVMARDGQVGLPEVKLGLVPGAGGTQRLPRLIGLPAALDLIASGRSVTAQEALAIGLVDGIADGDVRAAAIAVAASLIERSLPRLSERPPPAPDPGAWEASKARSRREARGRIAPLRAIELVEMSQTQPFAPAQRAERQAFLELAASDQSRALRHLFFAERESRKVPGLDGAKVRRIEEVGIVGAGTMGAGIAVAFLDAGFRVTLCEANAEALQAGLARIEALYARAMKSGRIDAATKAARLAGLKPVSDLAALATSDLAIEAVFEDLTLKRELLDKLERLLARDALIATNTSYLDIEAMADALLVPQRFLGLHFFSPAHVMKLVEIVRARRTSKDAIATALALAQRLQKIAVVCGVSEGFIGNRILSRFRAQCEFMLEEGALPREIDAALEAFGLAMGPFAVQDLAGLDIAWARRKRLAASRQVDERDVPIADALCEQGRFGQKTGRGWYRYAQGKRLPDGEVEAMIRLHAAKTGRPQRNFAAREIQDRVLAAMVNEGARLVEDKVAARPLDIDVVLVNGYGFPNWRGGPMHEADRQGLPRLLALCRESAARDGRGFETAPLLERLVREGRNFASLNGR